MARIAIRQSVGRNGRNILDDVAIIGAALVAVGPDNGGIYGVPLSIGGLAEAIEGFQRFHALPSRDGKVDPGGATLRKLNQILDPLPGPSPGPLPPPTPSGTGAVRPLSQPNSLATSVSRRVYAPEEISLVNDPVFLWTTVEGGGRIAYFEIDAPVVPRWFGVVVPNGTTDFSNIHIFFHPTPGQAGYDDGKYQGFSGWEGIFHYMTDDFAVQFCAAKSGRVLIMPVLPNSAASSVGMFPARWREICEQILGQVSGRGDRVPITSVVVSSFSSGISFSHNFRKQAAFGGQLKAVIDFDGSFSTYRSYSAALGGKAIRFTQGGAGASQLPTLAVNNVFPVPKPRWGGPYEGLFAKDPKTASMQIHGAIPQKMMLIGARRAG